ncbi:arogenate dehydratase 3, chloroplastic-like isoform X1 [Cucurbita maxima]|uniref:Arogenate dehydratase n=2 Tax=Cucurbita maxima TaxID=3661 RepID=A0A6J1HWM0_CUCMA|nr:arogenate dehydratase 3, chloroplastic-like isoform X1 [Cucurbita maxima]
MSPAPKDAQKPYVAYQGVAGAYSEAAAAKACPNFDTIPCDQFETAFESVENRIADLAILPIENSLGGSIHRNYDLLLRHNLHIIGEVLLPVHHCLMALPGVRLESVRRVISHPQALAQCEQTLTKLGLNAACEAFDDTAGAAEQISLYNLQDTAAIASARAAKIYKLEILANGIQDDSRNFTRFVVLSRDPVDPRADRPLKTSVVFALENGTSALFKALSAFAARKINLSKIESRPHKSCPIRLVETVKRFEYVFFAEFEASMAEVRTEEAMAELQEYSSFFRVLGCYPMDIASESASIEGIVPSTY